MISAPTQITYLPSKVVVNRSVSFLVVVVKSTIFFVVPETVTDVCLVERKMYVDRIETVEAGVTGFVEIV